MFVNLTWKQSIGLSFAEASARNKKGLDLVLLQAGNGLGEGVDYQIVLLWLRCTFVALPMASEFKKGDISLKNWRRWWRTPIDKVAKEASKRSPVQAAPKPHPVIGIDRYKGVLLILALVITNCIASKGLNGRLAYLASIRQPGSRSHICSGILVSKDYVLTAAHCVDETSVYSAGRKPILHIGPAHVDDIGEEVEVVLVRTSHIHPKYDSTQRSPYNVALLQLEKPSSKPHPILLSDQFVIRTGQHLQTGGWGSGGEEIRVGSNVFGSLKLEEQEFIQHNHCNRLTLWNGTVPEGIVCALNNKQKASCQVDSGAPLLLLDQPHNDLNKGLPRLDFIVGINVDGAPCGSLNKPDLFVHLGHIHNWIAQYIPDRESCCF